MPPLTPLHSPVIFLLSFPNAFAHSRMNGDPAPPKICPSLNLCYLWKVKKVNVSATQSNYTNSVCVAHQAPLSMEFSRQEYQNRYSIPFTRGYSQPRDQTQVSCIAGRFFTIWATREAHEYDLIWTQNICGSLQTWEKRPCEDGVAETGVMLP